MGRRDRDWCHCPYFQAPLLHWPMSPRQDYPSFHGSHPLKSPKLEEDAPLGPGQPQVPVEAWLRAHCWGES